MHEADIQFESQPLARQLARGVGRWLADQGCGVLTEFRVGQGRRVDVMGLQKDGNFIAVEIKSSVADFRSDGKWPDYLPYCDQFYFAVSQDFPTHILPAAHGLLIADDYEAAIVRSAEICPMNGTRRRRQLVRFGLAASGRLHRQSDPGLSERQPFRFV